MAEVRVDDKPPRDGRSRREEALERRAPAGREAEARKKQDAGMEATFEPSGPTRPFAFVYDWALDSEGFHGPPAVQGTKGFALQKKFVTLARIPWLLLCQRKTSHSYRHSFLFSVQPRDADPSELRVHKAQLRVQARQTDGDGALADLVCAHSTFAEVDPLNWSLVSFRVELFLEGEVVRSLSEAAESGEWAGDITRLMRPSPEQRSVVTLRLGEAGEELAVHREVLVRQSAVFGAMLREGEAGMREGREALVRIDDVRPEVVRALVHWLYTGRVAAGLQEEEEAAGLAELFRAADKYQLGRLREEAEGLLRQNLCHASVCTVLALADLFQAADMKAQALRYLLDNFAHVRQTPQFEHMVTQHPQLGLEILRSVSHK